MKASSLVKSALPIILLVLAAIAATIMIISKKPPEKKVVEEQAFLVDAQPVYSENIEFTVSSQGNVQPEHKTSIAIQVSGRVVSVADNFVVGGMFKQGDVLLTVEQDDYQTELSLAEAELAQAEAALQEELARGKVAAQEWRSVNDVVAPELGLRKPQLAKEQANVKAAKAKLARAQRNLSRTQVIAPYDGIVVERSVDLGQFVGTGSLVGEIYATDVAEIRLPLTDSDLAFIDLSTGIANQNEVTLSAVVGGKSMQWQGKLVRSEGVLDTTNRLIYAVVEVKDPYLRSAGAQGAPLRFGQFVKAVISGTNAQSLIVLPRNLLRLDGTVLVVDDNNQLFIRDVDVVRSSPESVFIAGGLDDGDKVVRSAVPNPYDGMPVRLPEENPATQDKPAQDSLLNTGA
ncbi:efflux RND transporter periplasmic adaptor subunit [Alteromonas gilva]|uniref:Efflux RND transporter periplasmic adaptor subunit n=1 Tax=Alteromonas gilva TaxID=2987522 RepID=A0ABT5L2E4_9ALTE|nr:efflux RND transporter periplasmic adaptor subunit [Alteromonas gilva]MDC8831213.1 efflux RND transporter periplasmic adaptor subunit [Alteromonas gilva]